MIDSSQFPKAKKIWYMGRFHDWSDLTVHSMTHALHYGTSVFEGIRAYPTDHGPAVFRLPEHIDRLLYSAGAAKMIPPYGKDPIIRAVLDTVRENGLEACYIRPLYFYSYGNLGLVPKSSPVQLVIAAWEWSAYLGDKPEQGVTVCLVPRRRVHHTQIDMRAKLGGIYVQSTIAGLDARAQGCNEAVFLNIEGRVAEGPGENVFIVKNGIVKTNDRNESVLEGITRTSILEIAAGLGFKTAVGPITKADFLACDEAFFTGTAVEIASIIGVKDQSDGVPGRETAALGSGQAGPATLRIRAAFLEAVHGKNPLYRKWLTPVSA
jgi:branched-chain amino acid aminotransferase